MGLNIKKILQTAVGGGGGPEHPQKTCIRAWEQGERIFRSFNLTADQEKDYELVLQRSNRIRGGRTPSPKGASRAGLCGGGWGRSKHWPPGAGDPRYATAVVLFSFFYFTYLPWEISVITGFHYLPANKYNGDIVLHIQNNRKLNDGVMR